MGRSEIVLALDTATKTGWAVFHGKRRHASGMVKLRQRTRNKVKEARAAKYRQLIDTLDASLDGDGPIPFVRKPDVLVIEKTGGTFKTGAAVEVTNGIMAAAELWAYENAIPVVFIRNWDVKSHATGNRMADKDKMLKAARKLWRGVRFADDNEADALHLGRAYVDGVRQA